MWKWMLCAILMCPLAAFAQRADGQRLATDAERSVVLEAVKEVVKDPDSARVSTLVMLPSTSGKGLVFCGFLNAKNSYGGYTGDQMFAGRVTVGSDLKPISAQVVGMDDVGTYAGSLACKSLGFPS